MDASGTIRQRTVAAVAEDLVRSLGDTVLRVAVDGVDGAGKTCFADELASVLEDRGVAVIRASIDGFHHPRAVRYRRGRSSPEGFLQDSFDLAAFQRLLLDPLGPGGDRRYVTAVYDVHAEVPVEPDVRVAPTSAVLLVDGIFLHRDELCGCWDRSIYLDVEVAVAAARVAERDGTDPDPAAARNRRYVEGQRRYHARCDPRRRASIVIDNTVLEEAAVVTP